MEIAPKLAGFNCVLVGNFNPAIFHPQWYGKINLFRENEIKEAKVGLIFPDFCQFVISGIDFRVELSRFQASTDKQENFALLKDVVLGTFSVLDQTPISAMGINFRGHFELNSKNKLDTLVNNYCPSGPWDGLLEKSKLATLINQGNNPFDKKGYVRIKIEPSTKLENGLFIEINNHFALESKNPQDVINVLNEQWEKIREHSFNTMSKISQVQ